MPQQEKQLIAPFIEEPKKNNEQFEQEIQPLREQYQTERKEELEQELEKLKHQERLQEFQALEDI